LILNWVHELSIDVELLYESKFWNIHLNSLYIS
jgi:hypothetical protein